MVALLPPVHIPQPLRDQVLHRLWVCPSDAKGPTSSPSPLKAQPSTAEVSLDTPLRTTALRALLPAPALTYPSQGPYPESPSLRVLPGSGWAKPAEGFQLLWHQGHSSQATKGPQSSGPPDDPFPRETERAQAQMRTPGQRNPEVSGHSA